MPYTDLYIKEMSKYLRLFELNSEWWFTNTSQWKIQYLK